LKEKFEIEAERENDKISYSNLSERSNNIQFKKINNLNQYSNNNNNYMSKNSSLSKFDKYSEERFPSLLHKKNNSIYTHKILISKNKFNGDENSLPNIKNMSSCNLQAKESPDKYINTNNKTKSTTYNNQININSNESRKFIKVSNDQLNKNYIKNNIFSDSQRGKNIGNPNDLKTSNFNKTNKNDLMNDLDRFSKYNINKMDNVIKNNNAIARNNSTSMIDNNYYHNNSSLGYHNNFNSNNKSSQNSKENLKIRDISKKNSINDLNKIEAIYNIDNFNKITFKVVNKNITENIDNYNLYPTNQIRKNLTENNQINDNSNIDISPPKSINYIGNNLLLNYPENKFAYIDNKTKENIYVKTKENMCNKTNSFQKNNSHNPFPRENNILIGEYNKKSKIPNKKNLIRDQEKEKEDKLFEFFLQYKNFNKSKRSNNKDMSGINHNQNNCSIYQQSIMIENYLGKINSINNTSIDKSFNKEFSNGEKLKNKTKNFVNIKDKENKLDRINNIKKSPDNSSRENKIENIKNVHFENYDNNNNNNYCKNNKDNRFNYTNQINNNKKSYVNRFLNSNNFNESNSESINKTYRKTEKINAIGDFNKLINMNSDFNKTSYTQENFHDKNNNLISKNIKVNNDRSNFGMKRYFDNKNIEQNENFEKLKVKLDILNESLDKLFLNKKFKIFDDLITFAYTKGENGMYYNKYNNSIIDQNLIENKYNNKDEYDYNENNNWNHPHQNNNENQYINNNEMEESKFNNLKINILKLNLFAIIRIFTKYQKQNIFHFFHKLRIFYNNIKLFDWQDNFLYFDKKYKLYKLDNAIAYRKLQYAVKLINMRKFALKHYFRVWKDLVFNFDSRFNHKDIFSDYCNLPNTNQIKLFNSCFKNNEFIRPSKGNLININDKIDNGKHILNTYSDNNKDKFTENINKTNNNKNNYLAIKNFSQKKYINKFITDKKVREDFIPKNIDSLINYKIGTKNYNDKRLSNINIKKIGMKNYSFAKREDNSFKNDRKISIPNKINSFSKDFYNLEEDDIDNLNIDESENERIPKKLIINNFSNRDDLKNEKSNNNITEKLSFIDNISNNQYNEIGVYEPPEKNDYIRFKIFNNFVNIIDDKLTFILRNDLINRAYFKLFILNVFGETPLREFIDNRIKYMKNSLILKYEALLKVDQIILRIKKENLDSFLINIGFKQKNQEFLDSLNLDEETLKLIDNKDKKIPKHLQGSFYNINLFQIYKNFVETYIIQTLNSLADYLSKKLPKNVSMKYNFEKNEIDFITELSIQNYCSDDKLNLFKNYFNNEDSFQFMNMESLNSISDKNKNIRNCQAEQIDDYFESNSSQNSIIENQKIKKDLMKNLFITCDDSKQIYSLL